MRSAGSAARLRDRADRNVGTLTMMRDPDNTQDAYALDRDRDSRMPYYISASLMTFLMLACALHAVLARAF